MNDEHAGQLTSDWEIPTYARDLLWIDSDSGSAQCEGPHGLFELEAPASILTLRWGSADGAPLTQLGWQADTLRWDGSIRLGGMVEALHMTEMVRIDDVMLAVILFSGQPLRPRIQPYPDASRRNNSTIDFPVYEEGVDDMIRPAIVTLLALQDSPLVNSAQDAMLQKMPLHVYGQLPADNQGWHHLVALPIIWQAVTLFAP